MHAEPEEFVRIFFPASIGTGFSALLSNGEHEDSFEQIGRTIEIPSSLFVGALENHAQLSLLRESKQFGGYLKFLPRQESIEFVNEGYINARYGTIGTSSSWRNTDLVDVSLVREFVFSGYISGDYVASVATYDENGEYIGPLLVGTPSTTFVSNLHFVCDGSYRFIRCGSRTASGEGTSLLLYYRDRRHG